MVWGFAMLRKNDSLQCCNKFPETYNPDFATGT